MKCQQLKHSFVQKYGTDTECVPVWVCVKSGWEKKTPSGSARARKDTNLEYIMRTETLYPQLSCQTRKWGLNCRWDTCWWHHIRLPGKCNKPHSHQQSNSTHHPALTPGCKVLFTVCILSPLNTATLNYTLYE